MSKLANDIALLCSHDNNRYLVKYMDPVLELEKNSVILNPRNLDQIART